MKTDFSINVQVNLGVTPEIVALVNAILCHRPTVAPTAEEALNGNGQVDNKPEDTTPAQPQQPTNKRGRKKKEEAAADKPETNGRRQPETNGRRQQPTKPMPTASRKKPKPRKLPHKMRDRQRQRRSH